MTRARELPLQSRRDFIRMSLIGLSAIILNRTGLAAGRETVQTGAIDVRSLSSKLKIMRRIAWTDLRPDSRRVRPAGRFTRITLHHEGANIFTGTDMVSVVSRIGGVAGTHRNLNYGDIAYHFVVDYAGRAWEGRPLTIRGTHVAGENDANIGVMALGNFEEQKPSDLQREAIVDLVAALAGNYSVSSSGIHGHSDLGYTLCPGRYLYPVVKQAKRTLNNVESIKDKKGSKATS